MVHLAKGTRDLLPETMIRRQAVVKTLTEVFARYGFAPQCTPAIERIETLTGKYGDDGEKLLYRILKRGEGGKRGEVDLALRYDLTVPLARVVAMNPDLRMPYKRYQVQPVWRADRPQKGRFREFYQCDVDTVGTTDPLADAECLAVLSDCLKALGFSEFTIRLNHRALLAAMVADVGASDGETGVLVALDKLDKIGRDGVDAELQGQGLSQAARDRLWVLLEAPGSDALAHLEAELGEAASEAVATMREVLGLAHDMGVDPAHLVFDPTLSRGLDYYTGPVFEAVIREPNIGSIAGGGRYDGLIGMFCKRDVPAVGISLGLERILVVMDELGMFEDVQSQTKVLVTVFSPELRAQSLKTVTHLRSAGVNAQISMDTAKLGKQFKRADGLGIPYAVVIGPEEAAAGTVVLKDLASGEQTTVALAGLVDALG
jgi:histidyl-tRNA synthetase